MIGMKKGKALFQFPSDGWDGIWGFWIPHGWQQGRDKVKHFPSIIFMAHQKSEGLVLLSSPHIFLRLYGIRKPSSSLFWMWLKTIKRLWMFWPYIISTLFQSSLGYCGKHWGMAEPPNGCHIFIIISTLLSSRVAISASMKKHVKPNQLQS